jgi:hypothetical protein
MQAKTESEISNEKGNCWTDCDTVICSENALIKTEDRSGVNGLQFSSSDPMVEKDDGESEDTFIHRRKDLGAPPIPIQYQKHVSPLSKSISSSRFGDPITTSGLSEAQKWFLAIILGLIFAIFSSGLFYRLTNTIFSKMGIPTYYGSEPSYFGLFLHTVIFILIIRLCLA